MNSAAKQPNGVFKSVCSLDCPDQCGLLVTKKDGKIVNIQGDPDHPVTSGNICNKVRHMAERIYDEKRVTVPLKRIGKKGEAAFAPISWEEAINTISARWKELIAEEGAESILPYSFYGNMGKLAAEGMTAVFSIVSERVISNGRFAAKPDLKAITIQWVKERVLIRRRPYMQSSLFFGGSMPSARICTKS